MKNILITGAGGGMGGAAARLFAERGYRVFALDRIESKAESENIIPIAADLSVSEGVKSAIERVKALTDTLDGIIHFAGAYAMDSLVEMSEEKFEKIFKINLGIAFLVNKEALPLLSKGSKIIITTSELAPLDPLPFTGIYAVTKAALEKYAYSLAMELQLLGISVSVIRAGAVNTGMLGASTDALDRFVESTRLYSCNAERFKGIVNRVEARNIPPEKIAALSYKIIGKRRPRFIYSINRNPLLLLLGVLPKRMQLWIIRMLLK
ncbi:MAG: SDR family NAD(P)-dependent oxidoreductase [Clostridia bacterium]|nr:SDR family NAD(P)-dependent oxidoreductase [Clostridia bacterium]